MKPKESYKLLPEYVLRTPLLSHSTYQWLLRNGQVDHEDVKSLCKNEVVSEAIFLASPSLHSEMSRWLNGEEYDAKEEERLVFSLMKYLSRMCSRPTPFGLFAGTALGQFEEKTNIELGDYKKHQRHTRLDMNYVVALSQDLVNNEQIRKQLKFYPNSSLYRVGDSWRYVEYGYINGRRNHDMVELEHSEYLEAVLVAADKGAPLIDLAKGITSDEVDLDLAVAFVDELVDSQVLVSEMEPSVSGDEFMVQLKSMLNRLEGVGPIKDQLDRIEAVINDIDGRLGNPITSYKNLEAAIKPLDTSYDPKYLIQTDMILDTKSNSLSKEVMDQLNKVFTCFSRLTMFRPKEDLKRFGEDFFERYETRELSLANALDVESGVQYKNTASPDVSPLVDGIKLNYPKARYNTYEMQWSQVMDLLNSLVTKSIQNGDYIIQLTDEDLDALPQEDSSMPDTLFGKAEIVLIDGKEHAFVTNFSGSSGVNLLGRFGHGDPEIAGLGKKIAQLEAEMNPGKLLAEIVHLPESRVGNILMRPAFREYEIPYLANSMVDEEGKLTIDDLTLKVTPFGRISLMSKKHGKEVIPRLSNAHNYMLNSLPIYNFLADMQLQGSRRAVGFNWSSVGKRYTFLPRVMYGDVIIEKARWNLQPEHLVPLYKLLKKDDPTLLDAMQKLREELKIPRYVVLAHGDNELLTDLDSITSVKVMLGEAKKTTEVKLFEYLYAADGVVQSNEGHYSNEVLVFFHNEQKLNQAKN